jgi:hypothetical protein
MELVVWILAIGIIIWVMAALVRRGRETDHLERVVENLSLREASDKYEELREFVVQHMMDPISSKITADQARKHIERCVSFQNRIHELQGGDAGPEYRVATRHKLVLDIKNEADRRRGEPPKRNAPQIRLGLSEANQKFEHSKEIVVLQMVDPINSGVTVTEAAEHFEKCVMYLNRICEIEGGISDPEYRLAARENFLSEAKYEAERRRNESPIQSAGRNLDGCDGAGQEKNGGVLSGDNVTAENSMAPISTPNLGSSGVESVINNIYSRLNEVGNFGSKSAEEIYSEQTICDVLEMTAHLETVVAMLDAGRERQMAEGFLNEIDFGELVEDYRSTAEKEGVTLEEVFADQVDANVDWAKNYGETMVQRFDRGELDGSAVVREFCSEQLTGLLAAWILYRLKARKELVAKDKA